MERNWLEKALDSVSDFFGLDRVVNRRYAIAGAGVVIALEIFAVILTFVF